MQQHKIEGFRLSPQQARLWSLQEGGRDGAFRARCAVRLEGDLDPDVLAAALDEVVERYEILRTTFHFLPELNLTAQVINDHMPLTLPRHDLRDLPPQEQERRLDELSREAAARPADFTQSPLLDLSLVHLSPRERVLLVTLPALCADAATLKNLVRELSLGYGARLRGERFSGEPIQYADIAEWQHELLELEGAASGRSHWREEDLSEPHTLRLPFESEQGEDAEQGFAPQRVIHAIAAELPEQIEQLAARHDSSAESFLLSCWQVLLWRLRPKAEITVGAAYDGRTHETLTEALGPLTKYVPVRTRLEAGFHFKDVWRQVDEGLRRARRWGEYFSWTQPAAGPAGDASGVPFFPICFEYAEAGAADWTAGDVRFSIVGQEVCFDRSEVRLVCGPRGGTLVVELHFDPALVPRAEAERLAERFARLVRSVVESQESTIGELAYVGERELRQLLSEWNRTETEYPRARCLHEMFEAQAARTPDTIALEFEGEQLSYRELNRRANQLAHYLSRQGVGPESLVGVLLERSPEMVVALLGVLKAGGAYVPLDPVNPHERLARMLEDAGITLLLTEAGLGESLSALDGLRIVRPDEHRAAIAREAERNPPVVARPDNLAYVIYTSGSTGNPKGVMIPHRAICNRVLWGQDVYPLDASDGVLQNAAFGFDFSVWEIFAPLAAGARLVLPRPGGHQDSAYLIDLIKETRVTTAHFVPTMFKILLEEAGLDSCDSLRRVFCGGEPLPRSLHDRFFERSNAALYNQYGPTETTVDSTFWLCRRESRHPRVPIGHPIANTRVYVLDERLNPVAAGVAGELHIGGEGLARGYLQRPEITAEKFIPHPFAAEPGARLYRTGDRARYLPDGSIEFLGRLDRQIKIRGTRIELGEIETTLSSHPGLREVVIALREDAPGNQRLVAYVVAPPESVPNAGELHRYMKERVPDHMIPSAFVMLDALPLLPSGKLDRQALPAPESTRPALEHLLVAPRTLVEEVLAGIWCEVLKVERVGVHDNFFELGGHSLTAMQLNSRVRQAFPIELPLRSIFEALTVAQLALTVETMLRANLSLPTPAITPVGRAGDLPLSYAQQRLWFTHQLNPRSPAYNVSHALHFKGRLDARALEQALGEICRRHEILRTTYHLKGERTVQIVAPPQPFSLPVHELAEPAASVEDVRQLIEAEARRPFDLERGPVMRAQLLRLGADDHVLMLSLHHIAFDEWSGGVFKRELGLLYEAFSRGEPSPLGELPLQYADFAHWQRGWLAGTALETLRDYWRRRLDGAPALLQLPLDRPRPPAQNFRGTWQFISLPRALGSGLKALSRRENVTLYMTMLTAFKTLLHRYSGQTDIVVGTPSAGRNQVGLEDLIGFFVNMLVLRTDLSGNPTFRDLLRQVREVVLGADAHQEMPFEMLVEELQANRARNRHPLFHVVFTHQRTPAEAQPLPDLSVSTLQDDNRTAKFDLTMLVIDQGEDVAASLEYDTDLFDPATITRMMRHYEQLLASIVASPDARLSDLEMLSETESALLERPIHIEELDRNFSF